MTIRKEAAEVHQLELSNMERSRELGIEQITNELEGEFEDFSEDGLD